MSEPESIDGVRYHAVDAAYFEKRGLRKYAGVWSLWALGVGAVISGDFFGWNFGLGAGGFGGLFIAISLIIGVVLAVLLDQRIRREGLIRTIYLYPMALSMIVTGTAWQWLLNPGLGLDKLLRDWGWEGFRFDWLVDPDRVIYCLVIAAVWQASGFVMALFLAGLRSVDQSIIRAAQVDGASLPTIYLRIVLPSLRPVFFSALMILAHIAIKSFDLVAAMTAGGPGYSSDLPAMFMYAHTFTRGQMGLGAASAMLMLGAVMAIIVPYLYSELRSKRHV